MRHKDIKLPKDVRKKNIKKFIRTIFQIIFCISIVTLVTIYIKFPKTYKEDDKSK